MPEIRKLWSKKNAVVFVWPGEEPLELAYDANRIVVPPRDVIGRLGIGSIYTHEAAVVAGRQTPGTAVVEDITILTPEGGYKTVLAIDHLCRYLTRDRDDLFSRGFNIVESVDQIQEAMMIGLPLYAESQVKRARDVLARELQRQKGYKDRGEVPPPSTSEHLISWAVKHLKSMGPQQQAHRMEDLSAVLEGRPAAPALEAPGGMPAGFGALGGAPAAHPDIERLARADAIFKAAMRVNVRLNGVEMTSVLAGNESQIELVETKIKAREIEREVARSAEVAASA